MIKHITKEVIESKAKAHAEKYRYVTEEKSWYQSKVDDFTAGFNGCLEAINNKECDTVRENLMQFLEEENKSVKRLRRDVLSRVYHATNAAALNRVIEMLNEQKKQ